LENTFGAYMSPINPSWILDIRPPSPEIRPVVVKFPLTVVSPIILLIVRLETVTRSFWIKSTLLFNESLKFSEWSFPIYIIGTCLESNNSNVWFTICAAALPFLSKNPTSPSTNKENPGFVLAPIETFESIYTSLDVPIFDHCEVPVPVLTFTFTDEPLHPPPLLNIESILSTFYQ
jgi:hypothetical protein